MVTFYYTYPKLLDNTTGAIPRGAKKQRIPHSQKHKDTQHRAKTTEYTIRFRLTLDVGSGLG